MVVKQGATPPRRRGQGGSPGRDRGTPRAGRPATAAGRDTRADILTAARTLFADVGFERTTMRAVATCAGVDVALIYHHFGSKEELLEAVLSVPEGARAALRAIPVGTAEPGKAVVRVLVEMWENDPELRRQALAMVRTGLSNEHAAQRLRDLHTAFVLTLVAEVASERDRELRAALIGSHLAGLLLTRYLLRVPALASLDPEAVIEAAAPALAHYLTGDIAGESAVGKRTPAPARRRKRVSATPVERGRQRAEKLNGR